MWKTNRRMFCFVWTVLLAGVFSWRTVLAEPAPTLADGETFTYALYLKHGFISVKAGMAYLDVKKRDEIGRASCRERV